MVLLITVVLGLQAFRPLQAMPAGASNASGRQPGAAALIPIQQQPFYGELELAAKAWSDVVLDQVVGNSPRATLLNFYAVMAEVGQRSERLSRVALSR
jgi:MscS family membrane protein